MKTGRTILPVIAVSVVLTSLWGCSSKKDKTEEPADSNSAATVARENRVPREEWASPSGLRVSTLTLEPLGTSPAPARLLLFPDPKTWSDTDAYPLFEKATTGLGPNFPFDRLGGFLRIEGPGFPIEDVKETLARFERPLAQVKLASK